MPVANVSSVDIVAANQAVRDECRSAPPDSTWAETMAVYAELGVLLESGRTDEVFVLECQDLTRRLVELHRSADDEDLERMALWCARNPIPWQHGEVA